MTRNSTLRGALTALAALAALVVAPATASAGPLVASATNCDAQTLGQPFLPFADVASYTVDPGGTFETGARGWALNGASVAAGNEPSYVTSTTDNSSLALPNGSSAISPPLCVGIEHPDIRFFAGSSSATASLKVDVLFEDAAGNVQSLTIGTVTGSTGWALTPPYPIVANLLPLLPGDHTAVAFRFTASGGSFRIDDLYVDPYARS
jgi:hypothetical protein